MASKYIFSSLVFFTIYGRDITNSQYDQLPVGLIAQLLRHGCTGIAEVMGLNPVQV